MGGRRWRNVTLGVVAMGLVAACGASVAAARLAACFRPHAPGADAASLSASARWADELSEWQGRSMAVLLVSSVVTLALAVVVRDGITRRAAAIGAAAAAVALGSLAAITQRMVQFDQIALWSVTVGEEIDGYWFAAFADDVRFVLVDNVEVLRRCARHAPPRSGPGWSSAARGRPPGVAGASRHGRRRDMSSTTSESGRVRVGAWGQFQVNQRASRCSPVGV